MEQLTGKVAVVSGGASGIGLALARRFGAEGMRVSIADVEPSALEASAATLRAEGVEVLAEACDVRHGDAVERWRDRVLAEFGAVHVVCNNAGVAGGAGAVWQQPLEAWAWVLDVNLWGVIHGIRAFVPVLVEQGEGHVVNTASAAGLAVGGALGPYAVSKHAVVALSESLRTQFVLGGIEGVGVTVLCPEFVRTRIHEAERNADPALADQLRAEPSATEVQELFRAMVESGLDPAVIAGEVVDAIRSGRFYVVTHDGTRDRVRNRMTAILDGLDPPTF